MKYSSYVNAPILYIITIRTKVRLPIKYSIKYSVLLFIYCFMKIKPKLFAKRI